LAYHALYYHCLVRELVQNKGRVLPQNLVSNSELSRIFLTWPRHVNRLKCWQVNSAVATLSHRASTFV